MLNMKQEEVLNNIVTTLQQKFPTTRLVTVEELRANMFWVTMIEPENEDQQMEFDAIQGELATDALMDYGFSFRFVPASVSRN